MTITVSYTPQNHPFTIHLYFFLGFYHASPAQHPQNFARIFLGIKAIKGLLMGKDLSTVSLKAEWCPNGTPQWCPNGAIQITRAADGVYLFFWAGVLIVTVKEWDISLMAGWFYFVDLSASSDFLSDMGI